MPREVRLSFLSQSRLLDSKRLPELAPGAAVKARLDRFPTARRGRIIERRNVTVMAVEMIRRVVRVAVERHQNTSCALGYGAIGSVNELVGDRHTHRAVEKSGCKRHRHHGGPIPDPRRTSKGHSDERQGMNQPERVRLAERVEK